ncbi:hypothetical protein OIU84_021796 [Salix udensis]|uniref:Uncharacterized protein n=1 Tax=Salix udensis TaxID=889485 RepID=A0AAD6PHG2_9ROSI|nr:hypothetical protein OIU84_021796 [Salix udensis]
MDDTPSTVSSMPGKGKRKSNLAVAVDSWNSSSCQDQIIKLANNQRTVNWMKKIRRQMHENPELAFEEFETSRLIRHHLDQLGIAYRWPVARTGVVATIGSGSPPLL